MAQIEKEELNSLQDAIRKLNESKIIFSEISIQAHQAQLPFHFRERSHSQDQYPSF